MTPSSLYKTRVSEFSLQVDPIQTEMMKKFDALQGALKESAEPIKKSFFKKSKKWQFIPGYYLWGGVGRGKTMLMDIFYECLDTPYKKRVHFHRFMQTIHQELRKLENTKNPLALIAEKYSAECRVLCLDEFHVNDIADAMILGGLLEHLFDHGLTLLTTSNRPPDDLYENGLQRQRFLPAIEKLKQYTQVLNIDNDTDYRLLTLQSNHTYHYPLNTATEAQIALIFATITTGLCNSSNEITIAGHTLPTLGCSEGAIWFDFSIICESNRSQNDYLEIAQEHHSVFISNIPIMDDIQKDAARRFLNLLDVFYDHKVKLIVTAAAPAHEIYNGKFLSFEFDRAVSRLIEMQSEEYLAHKHIID